MAADHSKESDARIEVDEELRQAGWNPADKSEVRTEVKTDLVEELSEEFDLSPTDSRDGGYGFADYVLYGSRGRPLAVVEAKKSAIQPYTAKQQALPYAESLDAPFIFLTNGELIYFWDYQQEDARPVDGFYSQRDLERLVHMRKKRKTLAEVPLPDTFFLGGEPCELRPYQRDAMKALDHALHTNQRRFLIKLPTGTGKTALVVLYLKRLMEAGWAERALFLVDRETLAKQALGTFQDLMDDYSSYWLKPGVQRSEKQITVALLQTMIGRYENFSSGYFDIVVADESHRSIYGAWQPALTHFDAFHIGLTATPAGYIERNTYRFYQCDVGKPDFSYSITDAFDEGYLSPYSFATGITKLISEGAEVDDEAYDPAQFERQWTNEETNRLMMEEFDRLAHENYEDLAPGQDTPPGKAIVFAITKRHAARLAQYLNELHPEHKGRYAEVINSDVADPEALIRKFKRETYPQVAVSVDMLTTGFDCPEVLHIVLCRRIRSPILYRQIRGRGTRTAPKIGKKKFVIYDFFGNKEYFDDQDTDLITGTGGSGGGSDSTPNQSPEELIELGLEDEWRIAVSYVEVGPEGERIDKNEYLSRWKETIRDAAESGDLPGIEKVRAGKQLTEEEEEALSKALNQPENYFNEQNLRQAYRNPGGTLIDFIEAALGQTKVKSQAEIIDENFQAWLVAQDFDPEQAEYLSLLKARGVTQGSVSVNDLFEPPLSLNNAGERGVELFGKQKLKAVVQDLNETVLDTEP
jgi:type I restriction enzyme R subunit